MKITEFYLKNTGPCTPFNSGPVKQIFSFEDLAHYVACYSSSMPFQIEIKRIDYTVDKNRYIAGARSTLGQNRILNGHPIIDKKTSNLGKFYVGNKLICLADIINFLTEQYGSGLGIEADGKSYAAVLDKIQTIMTPNGQTRLAQWHYLRLWDDVFVDKNLNGLWPMKIDHMPNCLQSLKNMMEIAGRQSK